MTRDRVEQMARNDRQRLERSGNDPGFQASLVEKAAISGFWKIWARVFHGHPMLLALAAARLGEGGRQ